MDAIYDGNMGLRKAFHFHDVNWDLAKVAIKRGDLDWLPYNIRTNETDFPMHQIALGKGPLRVVGFGEPGDKRFFIVLIDSSTTDVSRR